MLVKDAVDDYLLSGEAKGWSSHTIKHRRNVLGRLAEWEPEEGQELGGYDLEEVADRVLGKYVIYLRNRKWRWMDHPRKAGDTPGGLKESTIDAYSNVIRTFFYWCVERGLIVKAPVSMLPGSGKQKRNDVPKTLTIEEVEALLKAARAQGPREYALISFIVDSGVRACEAQSLTTDRLDLENRTAIVSGKGQTRVVYFVTETAEALREWIRHSEHGPHDAVFTGLKGPLTYNGIYRIVKQAAEAAGIKVAPHQLRHTFTIVHMEDGGNLGAASRLLGHSSVKVTADIYGVFPDRSLKKQHDRHSPIAVLARKEAANVG